MLSKVEYKSNGLRAKYQTKYWLRTWKRVGKVWLSKVKCHKDWHSRQLSGKDKRKSERGQTKGLSGHVYGDNEKPKIYYIKGVRFIAGGARYIWYYKTQLVLFLRLRDRMYFSKDFSVTPNLVNLWL